MHLRTFYVSNTATYIERFFMVKRYANVTQQCLWHCKYCYVVNINRRETRML